MLNTDTGILIRSVRGYTQVFSPDEIEAGAGLPTDMVAAFKRAGDAQRHNEGCPELVMRQAQRYFGGGVLTYLMEHIGDLTHRLTHHIEFGSVYPEIIKCKVEKGICELSRGQYFIDEHESNLLNNAEHKGIDENEMRDEMSRYLSEYVAAHERIPVYNRIQWYAREAAIQLGRENFKESLAALEVLYAELESRHTFVMRAAMISRNTYGGVTLFDEEDLALHANIGRLGYDKAM